MWINRAFRNAKVGWWESSVHVLSLQQQTHVRNSTDFPLHLPFLLLDNLSHFSSYSSSFVSIFLSFPHLSHLQLYCFILVFFFLGLSWLDSTHFYYDVSYAFKMLPKSSTTGAGDHNSKTTITTEWLLTILKPWMIFFCNYYNFQKVEYSCR